MLVYTWCGCKIAGLVLEHFLFKKLCNRNVVTLKCTPLPDSFIAPCESSTVGSKSSSDSLFMSSVAFAFTASTDSNLVPLNADLIFGNKSHMGLGQVNTVDVPTQ